MSHFVTQWTVAYQVPLSMEFSSNNTGVGSHSLLQGMHSLLSELPGKVPFSAKNQSPWRPRGGRALRGPQTTASGQLSVTSLPRGGKLTPWSQLGPCRFPLLKGVQQGPG